MPRTNSVYMSCPEIVRKKEKEKNNNDNNEIKLVWPLQSFNVPPKKML